MPAKDILDDKIEFIRILYDEPDPRKTLRLIVSMGVGVVELASGINASAEEAGALTGEGQVDVEKYRDEIDILKGSTLWLLRRGILSVRQTAMWMVEPDQGGRTPISLIPMEGGPELLMHRSVAFTRPEPILRRTDLPPQG